MTCPACGATNPDDARWCLQCFTEFDAGPADDGPAQDPAAGPAGAAGTPPAAPGQPGPGQAADAAPEPDGGSGSGRVEPPASAVAATADGRFRGDGEALDWRCPDCARWNPLERTTCEACGAALTDLFGPADHEREPAAADADPTVVRVVTALVPGVGHALLGRVGAGLARAAVWALWVVGGVALLLQARSAGGPAIAAAPLLLGAVVLWGLTQHDAHVLLAGRRADEQLLTPRVFLWLVVGVVGLLMLAFVAAALSLPGV